jgi:hypothetical protein
MNRFISILSILLVCFSSCGQTYKQYYFSDIGFNIKIPKYYNIQDVFPEHKYFDIDGNQITDTLKLRELEADLMKGLLIISTLDGKNTASINLALETSRTGDFEKYYDFSKQMQMLLSKQQMIDYDTASTILNIGNLNLYKFLTFSTNANPNQYSGIYIGKVNRYFLIIKTDYTEKKVGDNFEQIIINSKFN